jgi:hypothetical protein
MQRSSVRLRLSTCIRTAEVATSEFTRSACLPAIAHVSLPTCPNFSPAAFRIRSEGCSTEAPTIQSVAATQADIGPSRRRSAQIKAHSACHPYCGREITNTLLSTRNLSRHSQAEASHTVVRHHQGRARTVIITDEHCREGCDGATARRGR